MVNLDRLEKLIALGESTDREFKSDRQQLSDRVIYEEVVALANTSGGVLLIGVEDDGIITGAHPRHGRITDPLRLQSAIFSNTAPNINTRISVVSHPDGSVLAIEVDPYPEPCATGAGKALRRTVGPDGKPQTVPFYPRDQRSRRIDLGLLDFSAQAMESASFGSFNPLEFERLRQMVARLRGDQSLLELSDEDAAKALQLVETQVIDAQGDVRVNDTLTGPLLRVIEEIEARFFARNEEEEITVGMIRLPVPDYSPEGFREAFNNAILHRDYARLGAVYVQWYPDRMLITNPGGFPAGITLDNLLVHEPKPRSPRLAAAFKRIGLIEQTGRGVDKIYLGQLRYGRPVPDYTRSDADGVRVILLGGKSSLEFAAFVYEQDKAGQPLSLDELVVVNELFYERRTDSERAGKLIQKGVAEGRRVLELLHERGLVEARGEKRGRVYHLSASLYQRLGGVSAYVRARGFDRIQQREMVINALKGSPERRITRGQVMDLCQITQQQAYRLLKRLCDDGLLELCGQGRSAYYLLSKSGNTS
jgi:ATP-dependent DNA helicase RecG